MYAPSLRLSACALGLASLLAACGGGESTSTPTSAAREFAMRISTATTAARSTLIASAPVPKAAAAAVTITSPMVFDFAQSVLPALFPSSPPYFDVMALPYGGKLYDVRAYGNGNFLAVSDGEIWGLGPYTGWALVSFGPVSAYTCNIVPSACEPPPPTSSINECFDPAYASRPTGFKIKLVYQYTGTATGEQQIESEVKGPATFKGQAATLVELSITGVTMIPEINVTVPTTLLLKSYEQVAASGLPKVLGTFTDFTMGGTTYLGFPIPPSQSTFESVFNPPWELTEYTLGLGQSLTRTENVTTTMITPIPGTSSTSVTTTHKFEEKVAITVQGKPYNTCRYTQTTPADKTTTQTWYLIGKGVPVKSVQTTNGTVTETLELKSGSYNGTPL